MVRVLIVLAAVCAVAYGKYGIRMPSPRLNGRIVGGHDVDIKEVPYQASLLRDGSHICGASIIADSWVLTAGNCVESSDSGPVSVRVGSSLRNSGGSVHKAVYVNWHPQLDHDFALIKVGTPFKMSDDVKVIPLTGVEPTSGDACIVSGWGALSNGGSTSQQLQAVDVPIMDRKTCQEKYWEFIVNESMICAATTEGGKDFCEGDNGGPLVCNGVLAGVASWGFNCGDRNNPGVYANIAHDLEWIHSEIGI